MDGWVGNQLKQLRKHGAADNTIVIFFGDHGSGMPRHKRYAGDSGMRIPLIIYVPEKLKHLAPKDYQAGGKSKELVGFIDLAPTMLSLAGIEPPKHMHGRAFAGVHQQQPSQYLYGFRERMDERPDLSRSVRDQRYLYVRNYFTHLPAGQFVEYQMKTPTTKLWRGMFEAGVLPDVQRPFFEPHAPEELYDLSEDPHETVNLARNPDYQQVLNRFRKAHAAKSVEIRDAAFIPEPILESVAAKQPVQEYCLNRANYPARETMLVANMASMGDRVIPGVLLNFANSTIDAQRYWTAVGLLAQGERFCRDNAETVEGLMLDATPIVSVPAAEAAALYLDGKVQEQAFEILMKLGDLNQSEYYTAIEALNSLDRIQSAGKLPAACLQRLSKFPEKLDNVPKRGNSYVAQLLTKLKKPADK